MSPEELRPEFHDVHVPASLWNLLSEVEAEHVRPLVPSPQYVDFQPCTAVKSTTTLRMAADAAVHTFEISPEDATCVLNVSKICHHPQSARSPFRIQLTESDLFKKHAKRKSLVFQNTHSVSIQWMLKRFHPMVLTMARDEVWRPQCFKESVNGGMPEYQFSEPTEGGGSLGMETWQI